MARSLAHSKWCKYRRLDSRSFCLVPWVNARYCGRSWTAFTFHSAEAATCCCTTLQAWKHNELNDLKQSIHEMPMSLAGKSARSYAGRLADDHDLIYRASYAAEVSHNRAAKLTRSVIICDDDCTNLESRLWRIMSLQGTRFQCKHFARTHAA